MKKQQIKVTINGKLYTEEVEPRMLLSDFIREVCGLTGTHVGCEHGVCGACTVKVNNSAIRSCLVFAIQMDEQIIKTIESMSNNQELTDLQKNFIKYHGLQCGFCTPGILMSTADYLEENPDPSTDEIKKMLSGHLCRCTGYEGIVKAIEKTIEERKNKQYNGGFLNV